MLVIDNYSIQMTGEDENPIHVIHNNGNSLDHVNLFIAQEHWSRGQRKGQGRSILFGGQLGVSFADKERV